MFFVKYESFPCVPFIHFKNLIDNCPGSIQWSSDQHESTASNWPREMVRTEFQQQGRAHDLQVRYLLAVFHIIWIFIIG